MAEVATFPSGASCAAEDAAATTRDALFGGRVVLAQPDRCAGYRVNVDALLLAAFAACVLGGGGSPRRAHHAFDLGAGVGAVGLSLVYLGAAERVTMIEVDPIAASLATANAEANGWASRVDVVAGDVACAAADHAGTADLVVCNPPYVAPGRGSPPTPENPARRLARSGNLEVFLDAARTLLGRRGRACFVYPAAELTTLFGELRARGLEPKRARAVHGRPRDPARVVLVECAAGRPGGLAIDAPLLETDARGRRTPEIDALLAS